MKTTFAITLDNIGAALAALNEIEHRRGAAATKVTGNHLIVGSGSADFWPVCADETRRAMREDDQLPPPDRVGRAYVGGSIGAGKHEMFTGFLTVDMPESTGIVQDAIRTFGHPVEKITDDMGFKVEIEDIMD